MRVERVYQRPVVTASAGDSARRAAELMREHDVGFLPVCDERGVAVGVITDRDLVLRVCAAGRAVDEAHLGEIMSTPVVTCQPSDSLVAVEELMIAHRTQRILVTDERGVPLGVVAIADLAEHDRYETVARTYRKIVAAD
jgi:CBS domain-containing protein